MNKLCMTAAVVVFGGLQFAVAGTVWKSKAGGDLNDAANWGGALPTIIQAAQWSALPEGYSIVCEDDVIYLKTPPKFGMALIIR